MKTNGIIRTLIATTVLTACSHAATVIADYDNSTGESDPAFPYIDKVIMTANDSWGDSTSVGAWSYQDLRTTDPVPNPNRGWGHTTDWFLLQLTGEAQVTITMTSADAGAWAGFVVYSGESINDIPGNMHTYSNSGLDLGTLNSPWDLNGPGGTPGLGFLGNGHEASPNGTATGVFNLGPGLYTIGFGNAADSTAAPAAPTYALSITTIPEPSVVAMAALAAFGFAVRRRRA